MSYFCSLFYSKHQYKAVRHLLPREGSLFTDKRQLYKKIKSSNLKRIIHHFCDRNKKHRTKTEVKI